MEELGIVKYRIQNSCEMDLKTGFGRCPEYGRDILRIPGCVSLGL